MVHHFCPFLLNKASHRQVQGEGAVPSASLVVAKGVVWIQGGAKN